MAEWHRIITSPYTGSMSMTGSFNVDGDATITGNVTINGTASVENLIVKQIGYSSGSNQLGDAANDTQTLYGTVRIPTGSLTVTGSANITNGNLRLTDTAATIFLGQYGAVKSSDYTNVYLGFDANGTVVSSQNTLYLKTGNTNNGATIWVNSGTVFGTGNDNAPNYKVLITGSAVSGSLNAGDTLYVSGSRVGIGTSTPSVALNVIGHFVQNIAGYGIATNTLLNTRIDYYQYAGHQFRSWGPAGSQNVVTITGQAQRGKVGIMFDNPTASLHVAGDVYVSASAGSGSALTIYKSGSTVVDVQGSSGQLFSVTDSLSGSLFSVNTAAGLPTIEAFSDNTVNIGKFGTYPIKVVSLGTSAVVSGSFSGSGADLSGIPASAIVGLNLSQIATGSVSASVGLGTGSFSIVSGSSNFLFINNSGNIGVGTSTPFSDIPNVGSGSIDLGNPRSNVSAGGWAVLGKTSTNGYGAVGSNYYLDNANTLKRRNNDFFSAIGFEAGGFAFSSAGGGAVGSNISATYLAVLNYLGNFTIGNGSTTLGARLGVKGSGTTASTTSFLVQDSAGTNLTTLLDSGVLSLFSSTKVGQLIVEGGSVSGIYAKAYNSLPDNIIRYKDWNGNTAMLLTISGSGTGSLTVNNGTTSLGATVGIKSSGATSATTALLVQNSLSTASLQLTDDGVIKFFDTNAAAVGSTYTTFIPKYSSNNMALGFYEGSSPVLRFVIYRDNGNNVYLTTSGGNAFTASPTAATLPGTLNVASALTASSAIISGNVTVLGTASINTLIVNQTQLSTGSNQLGDAVDDFQTLYGTVRIPTGSLTVTGSTNISGSFTVAGRGNTNIGDIGYSTINLNGGVNVANTGPNTGTSLTVSGGGNTAMRFDWDNINLVTSVVSSASRILRFTGASQYQVRGSGTTSATTALLVQNSNTSSSLSVLDNNYVGVGLSSPSYPFHVVNSTAGVIAAFGNDSTNSRIAVGYGFGAHLIEVGSWSGYGGIQNAVTNGALVVQGTSGGNVLIGTTTNSIFKLDVNGSGRFTNNLTVTGSFTVATGSIVEFQVNQTGVKIGNATTDSHSITGSLAISASAGTGSALTVYKSGSTVMSIQGSQGELFSITDSLSGSLFSVSNVSGLPILEVFSDNTTLVGDYLAPALITTKRMTVNSGSTVIYSLPTASYDGAFFDYTIKSGSNARAGSIFGTYISTTASYTDTSTFDIGDTTGVAFALIVSGSNMVLTGSASTSGWALKTIIRSI